MASGTTPAPEVRSGVLTCTFNELMDYGNGIFVLNPPNSDPNKPTSNAWWMVLQFKAYASGAWYLAQFAVNTASSLEYFMRKRRGDSVGWTAWSKLTFS